MRTVIECLVIAALCGLVYFDLTAIPKQDYIHHNPYVYSWAR